MGRKIDALFGRNSKTTKLKTIAKLAISRIAILKNQRQVRCIHAKSDVIELLKLSHQESALLRVEHVIKEKKMLEAYGIIEDCCQLLIEKVTLIQKNKECPCELKEAVSSLIFAASRCGEFPELQELRGIFVSSFGNEFVARSVESRNNNNGVNPKIMENLLARQSSLNNRLKLLKEIASENCLELHFEEEVVPVIDEKKYNDNTKKNSRASIESVKLDEDQSDTHEVVVEDLIVSNESLSQTRRKHRDVTCAAPEAFESAAYAAAAAKAVAKLSRTELQDNDNNNEDNDDDNNGFSLQALEDFQEVALFDRSLSTSSSESLSIDEPNTQLSYGD